MVFDFTLEALVYSFVLFRCRIGSLDFRSSRQRETEPFDPANLQRNSVISYNLQFRCVYAFIGVEWQSKESNYRAISEVRNLITLKPLVH